MPNLLGKLKTLIQEIDDCGCGPSPNPKCPSPPCCPAVEIPFAQVCFTCPPYGPLPTCPTPVKPLEMPRLPGPGPSPQQLAEMELADLESRYANYYNYYNVDYRKEAICSPKGRHQTRPCEGQRAAGVTLDGKSPCCDCIPPRCEPEPPRKHGCPTGFKPCKMRLCPPLCCNPIGVWKAQLEPCPPGYKSKPPKPRFRDGCCT